MIEVEAKVGLKGDEVAALRKHIAQLGRYKGREVKIDDYYTLQSLKSYPRKSLRVRRRAGHYEVNFKQKLSYKCVNPNELKKNDCIDTLTYENRMINEENECKN